MKKYYNTRQVLRDVENGTLTPEEGDKILAEMERTAASINGSMRTVETTLENMGKGLEKGVRSFAEKLDDMTKALDSKLH